MSLMRSIFLSLARSQRLRSLAVSLAPVRSVAHRFVAGDSLHEAQAVARALNDQGLRVTLDHLGENVTSEAEALDAAAEVVELLKGIAADRLQAGVSVKLTQLGLDLSTALVVENLNRIADQATQVNRFLRIDMEDSSRIDVTLSLFEDLWKHHRNVGIVIQSYLFRSAGDIERLIELGASVRLVKGAYNEAAEIAFRAKGDIDANYLRLLELLFSSRARARGVYPAIATHDARLIDWAKEYTRSRAIPADRFEFQMLYGVRPGLQRELVAAGYRVRTYVPYGRQWYPYFMRRMAERPANLVLLVRSLFSS